jgi:trehalose 6-phosphate phosphatase
MLYLLSPASQPVLTALAQERTLCAFDFDGTLAPIVRHPDQARLSDRTSQLLKHLAVLYPCVVLSGRGRAELLDKLDEIPFAAVFGSHGAEGEETKLKPHPFVEQWKAALELRLSSVPGLWIEDKGLSLAVHYRDSPRKPEARRQVIQATQNLEQARIVGGKDIVNLMVDGDAHKGTALVAERDRLRCESVLYVGDDENDEDAFGIGGRIISVRIGRSRTSKACYYLRTQSEIDMLLERLVELREQASNEGRSPVIPR